MKIDVLSDQQLLFAIGHCACLGAPRVKSINLKELWEKMIEFKSDQIDINSNNMTHWTYRLNQPFFPIMITS
jgi:hypothetical protein